MLAMATDHARWEPGRITGGNSHCSYDLIEDGDTSGEILLFGMPEVTETHQVSEPRCI